MIAFGLVISESNGKEIEAFHMKIAPLKDPKRCYCREESRAFVQKDQRDATEFAEAIAKLLSKYRSTHRIVWVANPAASEWQWLKAYYEAFKTAQAPDIGYSAKCTGTLLSAHCRQKGIPQQDEDAYERKLIKEHKGENHMVFHPEHDARVQGRIFLAIGGGNI
jgi:hypothetical protein